MLTRPQRIALKAVYDRGPLKLGYHWNPAANRPQQMAVTADKPELSYRDFRKLARPMICGDGCVLVPWQGMWLGIEPDGYTHS